MGDERRTIAQLAKEALAIQDASNLPGLLHGWHRAACDLWAALADNPSAPRHRCAQTFRAHPIMILWSDKIIDLMGRPDMTVGAPAFSSAYSACKTLAGV